MRQFQTVSTHCDVSWYMASDINFLSVMLIRSRSLLTWALLFSYFPTDPDIFFSNKCQCALALPIIPPLPCPAVFTHACHVAYQFQILLDLGGHGRGIWWTLIDLGTCANERWHGAGKRLTEADRSWQKTESLDMKHRLWRALGPAFILCSDHCCYSAYFPHRCDLYSYVFLF